MDNKERVPITPEERYQCDPWFHKLVNMLTHFIIEAKFTPSELREAAILAAIHYELSTTRRSMIKPSVEDSNQENHINIS